MPTRNLTAVLVLVVALGLAGCVRDPGPEPTITALPTTKTAEPEPETDPQKAAEQEAIQAYKDFYVAYNSSAQNYFESSYDHDKEGMDWLVDIYELTTADFGGEFGQLYELMLAAGAYQVGEYRVSQFRVIDHQAPSGGDFNADDEVVFEVCLDSTGVDVIFSDGTSFADLGITTGRYVKTVTMWRYSDGSVRLWRVAKEETDSERPC